MNIVCLDGTLDNFNKLSMCVINKKIVGCARLVVFDDDKFVAMVSGSVHQNFTIDFLNDLSLSNVRDYGKWSDIAHRCGFRTLNKFIEHLEDIYKDNEALYIVRFSNIWFYEELVEHNRLQTDLKETVRLLINNCLKKRKNGLIFRIEDVHDGCIGKIYCK